MFFADTQIEYADSIPLTRQDKIYDGKKRYRWYVRLFDWTISAGTVSNSFEHSETASKEKQIKIGENFYLPVSFGFERVKSYGFQEKKYTKGEIQQKLSLNFRRFCNELEEKGIQIRENSVKIHIGADSAGASGSVYLNQRISKEADTEILTIERKEQDESVGTVIDIPAEHEANVFGQFDAYAKKLERTFHVTLIARDGKTKIVGEDAAAHKVLRILNQLVELSKRGNTITEQNVDYAISLVFEDQEEGIVAIDKDLICHTLQGKPIKPKTLGQKRYVDAIRDGMITFGLGPAGTGKTYLAMAMAITAFKRNEVGRIILTRPAIEAGEKLGFLPGDLQSKIDPYLRPLYDALYQIMGAESFLKNSEKGLIEVAPLAYMRGRTLDNAFIILDEAQNTTPAQMKMFLTRIGFGSKVVITGDSTQKDLPAGTVSGLDVAVKVVKGLEDISICTLTSKDVVRHPLVQKIVKAYEEYEKKSAASKGRRRKA